MQNQKRTWKVNIRKKNPTVLYLVSSIQYVVSDTCACDQTGQRKKERRGKKNLLHIHTKLPHNFNFMKNESRVSTRILTAQRPAEH